MAGEDAEKLQALNYICNLGDNAGNGWGRTAKTWFQWHARDRIVVWKDQDGKIIDATIDLWNKMCPQYSYMGAHLWTDQCQRWHICKRFLEGNCNGKCRRSHDFFDKDNRARTGSFGLEKFSNELIRRIVSYSFPQVCSLYLKSRCTSDDCPHLHICSSVVQQTACDCRLVHNNDDLNSHNKKILERHGLVSKSSTRIAYYAQCNILVPVEQRSFERNKDPFQTGPNEIPSANKTLFSSNRQETRKQTRLTINLRSTSSDSPSTDLPASKAKGSLTSKNGPNALITHSDDEGRKTAESEEEREKMPSSSTGRKSRVTSQESSSISKTPFEAEGQIIYRRADDLQKLHFTGKIKEAAEGDQKAEKMPPSSSVAKGSGSVPDTQDSKSHRLIHSETSKRLKLHPIDKGREAVEVNRKPKIPSRSSSLPATNNGVGDKKNEKIALASSDSSLTTQWWKNISDTNDGTKVLNTYSDDKGSGNAENEKEREKMPSNVNSARRESRVTSRESSSIAKLPFEAEGQIIYRGEDDLQKLHFTGKVREVAWGDWKVGKKPPSSSVVKFSSKVPDAQDSKNLRVRHPEASKRLKLHPIDEGREAFDSNQKSATNNLGNETNDVPSHPDLSSRAQERKDFSQGCQKGKLPLRDSQCKDTQQHESNRDWCPMTSGEKYKRVKLKPSSDEFNVVETLFRETVTEERAIITSIERVQNPFMWEKYCRKKRYMVDFRPSQCSPQNAANEKQLFHGTSPDVVDAICKQNFDWRLHGQTGTKYGKGSYFAVKASSSYCYAKVEDAEQCYVMFLARVLVGSYIKGQSTLQRPPAKDPTNPESDLYDSCVDNTLNPKFFVVFDLDQCYPEYIIKFLKLDSSFLHTKGRNFHNVPPSLTSLPQTTQPGYSQCKSAHFKASNPNLSSKRVFVASTQNIQSHTNPTKPRPSTNPGNSQGTSAHPKRYNSNLISSRRLAASSSNIQCLSRSATSIPPTETGDSPGTSARPKRNNSNLISGRRLAASTSNIQSLSKSAKPIPPIKTGDSPGASAHPKKYNSNLNSNRRLAASTSNIQSLTRPATPITPTEPVDSQGISRSGASVQNLFSNEDFSNSAPNHQRIKEDKSRCLIQ